MAHGINRAFIQVVVSHALLAIAAWLMVIQTKMLSTASETSTLFEPAIMVAVFCIYRLAYYGISWPLEKFNWSAYKELPWFLSLLLMLFFFLEPFEMAGLMVASIMAIAYMLEVGKWKGMRSLPIIKSIWVALVWTITTVVIPVFHHFSLDAVMLILERFLFLLSICIIYNLRDTKSDFLQGISTITHKIGTLRTKQLTILLLAIDSLVVYVHHYSLPVYSAINCSLFITAIIILMAEEDGHRLYYSLTVDATMIIQSLLVISAATFW